MKTYIFIIFIKKHSRNRQRNLYFIFLLQFPLYSCIYCEHHIKIIMCIIHTYIYITLN